MMSNKILRRLIHEIAGAPRQAVVVLIENPIDSTKILTVSRRNDPTDLGLPGGKVDPGETPSQALIREVWEETGVDLASNAVDLDEVFRSVDETGYETITYLATFSDDQELLSIIDNAAPTESNAGIVGWGTWNDIFRGSFGDYNRELYSILA